jgi:PAS domain S-box-containing protein
MFVKFSGKNNDVKTRIAALEKRLKVALESLQKISEGDHQFIIDDHLDTDEDEKQFRDTLLKTQERFKLYAKEEQERNWIARGMTQFMEVIQGDRNAANFYDRVLTMLIRYTNTNQGGIFLINEHDPDDRFLELKACYAYSKKKFVDKRIGIGQGMLGQAFLENESSIFTIVPDKYFQITSGLGESTPRFLLVVPLRYDNHSVGIIEMASFNKLEKFQIGFIEKIAESLASVIINIQHASRATILYEESQEKAKMLLEQEETLRQNIEELVSTQEEMKRNQQDLDQRSNLLKFIVDNIPFPIFVKDEKGRYTLVNQAEARLFNLTDSDLIGKDDSHFVTNKDEWSIIQQSDARVLDSNIPLELPMQNFTTAAGASYVFKTTKISFLNQATGKKNILGVSIDLTEKLALEEKLLHERSVGAINTMINVAGRQRMLSQKIGFYAEMVIKGKHHQAGELRSAVDLFEHSLKVMREGGLPMGISCESPLVPEIQLRPYLQKVERLWAPYKEAANKILYYYTFRDETTSHIKEYEVANSILYIENHSEELLGVNNDLMLACIKFNEEKIEQVA